MIGGQKFDEHLMSLLIYQNSDAGPGIGHRHIVTGVVRLRQRFNDKVVLNIMFERWVLYMLYFFIQLECFSAS